MPTEMESSISEHDLHALGIRLRVIPPTQGVETSGSILVSGKGESVTQFILGIARLDENAHPLKIKSLANEVAKKIERGEGEVNIEVKMEDGRDLRPRVDFQLHEDGVLATILTGGEEKSFSYADKYEIVRRAIDRAIGTSRRPTLFK